MHAHEIELNLRGQGVLLRTKDGKVYGPREMTPEQKRLVSANKEGLLLVLTRICQTCGGWLRCYERPNYWALGCSVDPAHYSEVVNKRPGQPMGLTVPLEDVGPRQHQPRDE